MEIIALLIGLVILAAIGFYVSRPLVQSRRAVQTSSAVDVQSLEAQRESLYTQIKELDLDHATGKVNDEDYARLRADLVAQAAAVLKQIDGMTQPPAAPAAPAAARRSGSLNCRPPQNPIDLRAESGRTPMWKRPSPRGARPLFRAVSVLACPNCGKPISADDAFCAKCGTALQTQATP